MIRKVWIVSKTGDTLSWKADTMDIRQVGHWLLVEGVATLAKAGIPLAVVDQDQWQALLGGED